MTTVPDDVLDALAFNGEGTVIPPADAVAVISQIVPHADALRAALAGVALIPVIHSTPEQRTALWVLRTEIDRARQDLSTWVDAIDISYRQAAIDTRATEILLADGQKLSVEPPRGEWVVNVPVLRQAFKELMAHGLISQDDVDAVLTTVVTEKADNSKLNVLAKKRGEDVAAAIEASRTWKDGNPMNAKLRLIK